MKLSPFEKVNQNYQSDSRGISYTSNCTVTQEVLALFIGKLKENLTELGEALRLPTINQFVRLIALIISHTLKLTVKHVRWIFAFTGKIYKMYDSLTQLEPAIRELCEQISIFFPGFICDPGFVKGVIAELNQICIELSYPSDISRFIAFSNGILDLFTMKLMPFQPGLFLTSIVEVDWNPYAASCPNFDKLLSVYTHNDPVLNARLLEALGVLLTNDIVKSILCFEGITNSGKSFIVNYVIDMLNSDTVVSMSPEDFGRQFALAKIFGKSICVCHDMPGTPLEVQATSVMKQISGGDRIGAEFKYQNGNVSFVSRAHLILCSNFNISSSNNDIAFNLRKVIIPFTHRITDENIHPDKLKELLYPEREAIVQKLICAYVNLKNNNYIFSGTGTWIDDYVPPNAFEMSRDKSISMFISNCCHITNTESDITFTSDLYNSYAQFAFAFNAFRYNDAASFSRDFSKQCPCRQTKKRRNHGDNPISCFVGIRLN